MYSTYSTVKAWANHIAHLIQHAWAATRISRVHIGRSVGILPPGSIVLFPIDARTLCCGLSGIVAIQRQPKTPLAIDTGGLDVMIDGLKQYTFLETVDFNNPDDRLYIGRQERVEEVVSLACELKRAVHFHTFYSDSTLCEKVGSLARQIERIVGDSLAMLTPRLLQLTAAQGALMHQRIDTLKDAHWFLTAELLNNVDRVKALFNSQACHPEQSAVAVMRNLNAVLNSIDRLEVRGRDSAGISLLFVIDCKVYKAFEATLKTHDLASQLESRCQSSVMANSSIFVSPDRTNTPTVTVAFAYKIAAEIGNLGDNTRFLRRQIHEDHILQSILALPHRYHTVSSHTRWASVGAITEPNCHPVDNVSVSMASPKHLIHVCLNGDIDNHYEIKARLAAAGKVVPELITTDTKIIPLLIEYYFEQGITVAEAFRFAVNDFEGSHAISMHTDLAPGQLFLAQRGSGQAVYVGIASGHYMPVSELYGLVEETDRYIKLDGDATDGANGTSQPLGQIVILDQSSVGGLEGVTAMRYDGRPTPFSPAQIQRTEITSRDIDRQNYAHYFLKEIHEAPQSLQRTIQPHIQPDPTNPGYRQIHLAEEVVPASLRKALLDGTIKRIFFIGQGTAGVAAKACTILLVHYLNKPGLRVDAVKSSELSGFMLAGNDLHATSVDLMDTLVIAISQSGTTTDTNRSVDMARACGAHCLAIVNRRDSDLTGKVHGVLYTSSGRDIEMSVASTKAFYAQIAAGAVLGLFLAQLLERRTPAYITGEIERLLALPDKMCSVLNRREEIGASAKQLATRKTYWAAVGSGPNKAAADEIRIKLSELCYKTISSDFVEDKKHIDLSSEPLIIVCAAGTRPAVQNDLVKDTAIFKAHKACPIVVADNGDDRYGPHADYVIHVPVVAEHLAPVINTMVGHLWGYYAALAIQEGSRFFFDFREALCSTIDAFDRKGLDIYEIVLEKSFREQVADYYARFQQKKRSNVFPDSMGGNLFADLTLLFKYLSGRLPVTDFELDFGRRGTARNLIDTLFDRIDLAINFLSRPIDAIKHQAKTVTVGTSRIRERIEGLIFDALAAHNVATSRLSNQNVLVLRNLQRIIGTIEGAIFYHIDGLSLLGETNDETTIDVIKKSGVLAPIPSRVETDNRLKGTKRIIVQRQNVYIGKGRKDDRNILVIPILSESEAGTSIISHILLLNIGFKSEVATADKVKALGGKYEHIKNIVQESSIEWRDDYLDMEPIEDLFGLSAEKVGERIVRRAQMRAT
jgi:glucosamine--fructose-6-phosphate aminotransferase (isomerizing)